MNSSEAYHGFLPEDMRAGFTKVTKSINLSTISSSATSFGPRNP